ncbi:MAG: PDZ domain-containing protein [Kiritimatiellia bacterium]
MASRFQRTVLGVVVLLALAGGIALGIWLNGRWHKKSVRAKAETESDASAGASRVASVLQKKADAAAKNPAPRPQAVTSAGTPEPIEAPKLARIKGKLVDTAGNPIVMDMVVFSPEGRFTVNAVNGVFEAVAPPGALRIVGQYRDGVRVAQTAAQRIEAVAGETTEVALVVEVNPVVGTPGFRYKPEGEFLEVISVEPDSAAAEAGMAPGDAIIEIGGQAVKDLDPAGLGELLNGPPGSSVAVTVVAETDQGMKEFPLQLERRAPVR